MPRWLPYEVPLTPCDRYRIPACGAGPFLPVPGSGHQTCSAGEHGHGRHASEAYHQERSQTFRPDSGHSDFTVLPAVRPQTFQPDPGHSNSPPPPSKSLRPPRPFRSLMSCPRRVAKMSQTKSTWLCHLLSTIWQIVINSHTKFLRFSATDTVCLTYGARLHIWPTKHTGRLDHSRPTP